MADALSCVLEGDDLDGWMDGATLTKRRTDQRSFVLVKGERTELDLGLEGCHGR